MIGDRCLICNGILMSGGCGNLACRPTVAIDLDFNSPRILHDAPEVRAAIDRLTEQVKRVADMMEKRQVLR